MTDDSGPKTEHIWMPDGRSLNAMSSSLRRRAESCLMLAVRLRVQAMMLLERRAGSVYPKEPKAATENDAQRRVNAAHFVVAEKSDALARAGSDLLLRPVRQVPGY